MSIRVLAGVFIRNAVRLVMLAALTLVVVLLGLALLVASQARRDQARPVDVLIVMGAAQWNGTPSPIFQARLDHAAELYRRGLSRRVLVTGGVGDGDIYSEAAVGRQYLIERGLPEAALLVEPWGRSTWQSIQAAAAQMQELGLQSALIVSDDFHMLRALAMAQDLGIDAYGSPVNASPIQPHSTLWARMVLREAGAMLYYQAHHLLQ